MKKRIRKNIFACLFSIHNTISLSRHEQVCLLVHDVINLLYYFRESIWEGKYATYLLVLSVFRIS